MKIAFVAEMFYENPFSGIAIWAKRLSNFLSAQGIKNKIYSYADCDSLGFREKIKLVPDFRELFVYPYFGASIGPEIEQSFDLIHFASPFTTVKYRSKIRTITTVHYLISRQIEDLAKYLPWNYKLFFNPVLRNIYKSNEKKGLANTDLITVVRKSFKDYLVQKMDIPEHKIRYVPNGIDTHFFRPYQNGLSDEPMAIFVGRGTLAKGFDTVLKAAPKINGKIVAVLSRVSDDLKKMAQNLPNVEIRMKLDIQALRNAYQNASVFIMPSLTEGNPLSTLEAMSCGLPVVCTEEGGGDNIEDGVNGYLFAFQDANALVEKVNYLFQHREIALRISRKNRQKIERENKLSSVTAQMIDVYKMG